MENLTAKQLEEKIGFGECYCIFIGEFRFEIYIDYDVNGKYGCGKSYIHINHDSDFDDVLDLRKQYTTTETLEKDIKKQLTQLTKRITKALKE